MTFFMFHSTFTEIVPAESRLLSCESSQANIQTVDGWRLGVVVSVVGRINEVNQHRARLVHDG